MAVGAAYRSKRTYGPVTAIWSCKIPLDCHQDACSQQAVNTNFVCYYRVSTTQQGQSGLGLDAQRQAVRDYAQKVQGTILDEQVEVSRKMLSTNALIGFEENGGFMFGKHNQVRDGCMSLALKTRQERISIMFGRRNF